MQTLRDFFAAHPKAAVALSGGTDSSYLFYAAHKYGCDVHGYFFETPFQPASERRDASQIAQLVDAPLTIVEKDVLEDACVAENGPRRCYWCKRALFMQLCRCAAADGYTTVLDGTNATDDSSDRPGMLALQELGVLSPLRMCGLGKDDVRRLSREAGLFTADKPAYACLATRVPTGEPITYAVLQRVEQAEGALARLGFSDYRVRVFHGAARIQLPEAQFPQALAHRAEICRAMEMLFDEVLLDLKPR